MIMRILYPFVLGMALGWSWPSMRDAFAKRRFVLGAFWAVVFLTCVTALLLRLFAVYFCEC